MQRVIDTELGNVTAYVTSKNHFDVYLIFLLEVSSSSEVLVSIRLLNPSVDSDI